MNNLLSNKTFQLPNVFITISNISKKKNKKRAKLNHSPSENNKSNLQKPDKLVLNVN